MAATNYFWQGGRKIAIQKDDAAITIRADSPDEARAAAQRAGVALNKVEPAGPGLVRATGFGVPGEQAADALRTHGNVVHHVYRGTQGEAGEYLVTETFFIKFKPGTPDRRVPAWLAGHHLLVEREMGNKTYLVRVTDASRAGAVRAANTAAEEPDVEYAEPNLVRRVARFACIPPDLAAGAGIFAADAWELTRGRRDIVVAVADDGFDLSHPDFQEPGKVVARLGARLSRERINSAIVWDGDVSPQPGDHHGTPCLGVAGVAPGCALVAVRFPIMLLTDAHYAVMFEKISQLADVVSCSWGVGPSDNPPSRTLSETIARLAREGGRRRKGLIFCVAAGNNNCPVQDLDNTHTYRYRDHTGAIHSHRGPVERWIAAHPDVITVSASATPAVAGVCGLILSANPALSAQDTRSILEQTADKDLAMHTHTPVKEAGGFNADGLSLCFGHGKVNALRAVRTALAATGAERKVNATQDQALDIPDAGTAVLSTIEINDDGTIKDLRVQVRISHTFVGDLRVDLIAPDSTGIVLHNQTGGGTDNLVKTWSVQDTPALRPLLNRSIRGTWQLRVTDTFRFDQGRLEEWRIAARVA